MQVVGTDVADNLNGSAANDDIYGRRGDDYLFGFEGDDNFIWLTGIGNTLPNRATVESSDGSDVIDGGSGTDRLLVYADYRYNFSGRNSDVYGFTSRFETGGDGQAHYVLSQGWDNYGTTPTVGTSRTDVTLRSIETMVYTGTAGAAPVLFYPQGADTKDVITVGDLTGTSLIGMLVFSLGTGDDSLDASAAINRIAASGGSGNDSLRGGSADDELVGGIGNDVLAGGGGTNVLIGGDGNDSYSSDNRFDTVVELVGGGHDTVQTRANFYLLASEIEDFVFAGVGDFTGIGNASANAILGSSGSDYLIGLGGDDRLEGAGSSDTMQGGTGDDLYIVSETGDTLVEFANEGVDTVIASVRSFTLSTNLEHLIFYDAAAGAIGTGNALDNNITGGSGNDMLYGLGGNDLLTGLDGTNTLVGGTGDDIYMVNSNADVIAEAFGEGIDLVRFSGSDFTLAANVENLTAISGGVVVRGNELDNVIGGSNSVDNLSGYAGNDTLLGSGGGDFLSGYAGDDILDGGAGGDELNGGIGADRFVLSDYAQDLIHDFSRSEGDRIDVRPLLAIRGYTGSDPFADGYLSFAPIQAFGSGGAPATRVFFDPDGSAGSAAAISILVVLGSTTAASANDFIIG